MATAPPNQQRVAQRIEREERRRHATKLAVEGYTYQEIADQLGYNSPQAAHKDVKAGLAPAIKARQEAAEELIQVQHARLERMYRDARAIFEEFGAGDEYSDKADQRLAAMDRMLKVGESLRKLVGADAPAKTENKMTVDGTVSYQVAVAPEELEQL
jgi:AraC-like DNA-binding protein